MSKRRFTEAQIAELSKNKNVSRCSDKSITYSKEFKVRAVKQYYENCLSPRMIFKEAGFDLALIGSNIPDQCFCRWKRVYNFRGVERLSTETRGKGGGRPKTKGLTDADRIKRLEVENAYLKAENDFLAKLRAAKKR
jgi:transposase-like protein